MNADVRSIIYDPVSWIHPTRFLLPIKLASARCRSVLNDIIIYQYRLSTQVIDLANNKENYLANHWGVLGKAAFMAVCHRYRSSLAYNGLMLRLDPVTLQFTQSELTASRDEVRGEITFDNLNYLACKELMAFSSTVSLAMKERIPLLFPEVVSEGNKHILSTSPADNEILIRMAIQHAKRNS
ncbi:hypothetical protein KC222_00650 [Cedecea davisae]|uniref:Uncharacterized protein n=1 Tax=Cedecea davisae TaxID=158484 RepID=A0ABS6DCG0_9ENTR|nr:hypothetical protein [Cedecea davisae]MBU4680521.1 hypothetical protein [Cedecea davisae]MBU4685013.1 hypothetical protein [Cedecea davisae]